MVIVDDKNYICNLYNIEDLLHYEHALLVFNPLHIGCLRLMTVKIVKINPIINLFPRLPKKNLLALSLGQENQYRHIYENGKVLFFHGVY